jgi:hypothetical protein
MTYTRADPFAAELNNQPLSTPLLADTASSGSVDTLSDMGEALLEIVRSAAVECGVTLPARQSVYMAPIPADCEQVAVLFSGWDPSPAPSAPIVCRPFRWMAGYSVIITRCTPAVPNPKAKQAPVTAERMVEAARLASKDAEVMLAVVNRLGEVGSDLSVVTQPPSGGLQTVELNVQLMSVGSV